MAFLEYLLGLDEFNGQVISEKLGLIAVLFLLLGLRITEPILVESLDLDVAGSLDPFCMWTLVVIELLSFIIVDPHFDNLVLVVVVLSKERLQAYGGRHRQLFVEGLRKLVFHSLKEGELRA